MVDGGVGSNVGMESKSGYVGDGIDEVNEAVKAVDPVFEVVFFVFVDRWVTRLSRSSR